MENLPAALEELLKSIIRHGGFALDYAVRKAEPDENGEEAPEWVVDFSGPDTDLLLERNAALLDALEDLLLKAVRIEESRAGKIGLDCRGWRRVRTEELRVVARMAAERVRETGERFELSPMNPRERRIVHLALKDLPDVRTLSEGFGTERKVVIAPAKPPSPR